MLQLFKRGPAFRKSGPQQTRLAQTAFRDLIRDRPELSAVHPFRQRAQVRKSVLQMLSPQPVVRGLVLQGAENLGGTGPTNDPADAVAVLNVGGTG